MNQIKLRFYRSPHHGRKPWRFEVFVGSIVLRDMRRFVSRRDVKCEALAMMAALNQCDFAQEWMTATYEPLDIETYDE